MITMKEEKDHDVEEPVGPIEDHDTRSTSTGTKKKRRWLIILAVSVVGLICFGVGLGIYFAGSSGETSSEAASAVGSSTPPDSPAGSCNVEVDEEKLYLYTGCFQDSPSDDSHGLSCGTPSMRAKECSEKCYTRFFSINDATKSCKCFSVPPTERLTIGSCSSLNNENRRRAQEAQSSTSTVPVELYFNLVTSTTCSLTNSETVRNKLVEEDNAQFGFDIVSNTFRSSPFELFGDGCGTNMYKVYTDVSEEAFSTQTSVMDVTEFAEMRRSERSQSFSVSVKAKARIKIVDVAGGVSASYDAEQTNLFQSSGASQEGSKVFIAQGVKRVARVEMDDFEGTRSFVTFSPAFGNRLRNYMTGGFQKQAAYDILEQYGQFVLTRGMFGGFMELRMTMTSSDYSESFLDAQSASTCFQAAVSGEVGVLGLGSVSSEYGAGFCDAEQEESMRASRRSFREETNEAAFDGARSSCSDPNDVATCTFEVDAETSKLLITNDKYPQNDPGVHFQLLSDFLSPDKISPLEVRRLQITEEEFDVIQENFENHTLEYLEEVEQSLGGCTCDPGDVVYLVADSNGKGRFGCECYDPDPATPYPRAGPTPSPTLSGCNGVPHQIAPNDDRTPEFAGSMSGSTWCKDFLNIACYPGSEFKSFGSVFEGTTSKWFKGEAVDQDSCAADVKHRVTLFTPPGVDYKLTVYVDGSSIFFDSSEPFVFPTPINGFTASHQVEITKYNRGYPYWVYVEYVSGTSCTPWNLLFEHYQCDN